MLTAEQDRKEVRVSWILLVASPILFILIAVPAFMGVSPGIEAGHPAIYLEMTCFAWAAVSVVLPILRIARLVSVPWFFLAIVYFDMFFYVISLNLGFYMNISFWGDMGHVISSMVVTMIVFIALCVVEHNSPAHVTFGRGSGLAIMVFLVAISFGGVWEMIEGFMDFAGGESYMVYGATDTMGDLCADLLGALFISAGAYILLKKHTPGEIASTVRFGKPAFETGDEIES